MALLGGGGVKPNFADKNFMDTQTSEKRFPNFSRVTKFGIAPAWEEESPGRNPKSLKKKSRKSPGTLGPQKSEKSLGESPKSLEKVSRNGFFRDFSDSPRDFFQTFGARGSQDFFETFSDFWGFGPETPPPRPGRSQTLSSSERLFVSHQRVSAFPATGADLWQGLGNVQGSSWNFRGSLGLRRCRPPRTPRNPEKFKVTRTLKTLTSLNKEVRVFFPKRQQHLEFSLCFFP